MDNENAQLKAEIKQLRKEFDEFKSTVVRDAAHKRSLADIYEALKNRIAVVEGELKKVKEGLHNAP